MKRWPIWLLATLLGTLGATAQAKLIWPQLSVPKQGHQAARTKLIWPQLTAKQVPTAINPMAAALQPLIYQAAARHLVDVRLIHAVIAAESNYQIRAISPKGALGLMQVMPATAKELGLPGNERQLLDPAINIEAGTRYLAAMLEQFGALDLALAAYNAGPNAVRKAGFRIPDYSQTQNYVRQVLRHYRAARTRT